MQILKFFDNDAFQSFLNGLYITVDQGLEKGLLLALDLLNENSKLPLYYHNSEADSLSYDFQINSSADRMTRWLHDYSATEIEEALNMGICFSGLRAGERWLKNIR